MKQLYSFHFNLFKIKAVLLFVFGTSSLCMFAQQDAQYTQYMYNTSTINPAYAGSQESINAMLLYRNQWMGLEGAPKTLNFAINSQLTSRTGGGLSFTNDVIGPSIESTVALDYSYTIPVGEMYNLAFGIKGGFNLLNVDYTLLSIYDPTDLQFQQNIDNQLTPIVGTGAFFYNEEFYIGLSVPNLLSTEHYDDNTVSTATERPNFYFISGYVFELERKKLLLKPALLVKHVTGAPIAIDVSANLLINQKLTLGAAYRLSNTFSALAGFQINENIFAGYGYDLETSNLGNYNSGSHEIMLRYTFGDKRDDRLLSPRFF